MQCYCNIQFCNFYVNQNIVKNNKFMYSKKDIIDYLNKIFLIIKIFFCNNQVHYMIFEKEYKISFPFTSLLLAFK